MDGSEKCKCCKPPCGQHHSGVRSSHFFHHEYHCMFPLYSLYHGLTLLPGNPIRPHRHSSGTLAPAPTLAHQSPARTRSGTHQVGAKREETHNGHQEERKGWPNGTRSVDLTLGVYNVPSLECMQSHGQGSCPDSTLRPKVPSDAHSTTSSRSPNTNPTEQPADGRGNAWSHSRKAHRYIIYRPIQLNPST